MVVLLFGTTKPVRRRITPLAVDESVNYTAFFAAYLTYFRLCAQHDLFFCIALALKTIKAFQAASHKITSILLYTIL